MPSDNSNTELALCGDKKCDHFETMKKLISPSLHAFLDVLIAVILLGGPWLSDFQDATSARTLSVICGGLIALSIILTDFPGGIIRWIPLAVHLWLDALVGLILILLPIVGGMESKGLLIAMGLLLLGSAIFSVPGYKPAKPSVGNSK